MVGDSDNMITKEDYEAFREKYSINSIQVQHEDYIYAESAHGYPLCCFPGQTMINLTMTQDSFYALLRDTIQPTEPKIKITFDELMG